MPCLMEFATPTDLHMLALGHGGHRSQRCAVHVCPWRIALLCSWCYQAALEMKPIESTPQLRRRFCVCKSFQPISLRFQMKWSKQIKKHRGWRSKVQIRTSSVDTAGVLGWGTRGDSLALQGRGSPPCGWQAKKLRCGVMESRAPRSSLPRKKNKEKYGREIEFAYFFNKEI